MGRPKPQNIIYTKYLYTITLQHEDMYQACADSISLTLTHNIPCLSLPWTKPTVSGNGNVLLAFGPMYPAVVYCVKHVYYYTRARN